MLTRKEKKLLHKAILTAEANTTAEIHIAFYKRLRSNSVTDDAKALFIKTELDKGKDKNNVLIYILESERCFAILGDEGIHKKVGDAFWDGLCCKLSKRFKQGEMYLGLIECLEQLSIELTKAFPEK